MKFPPPLKRMVFELILPAVFSSCGSRGLRGSEPSSPLPPRLTAAEVSGLMTGRMAYARKLGGMGRKALQALLQHRAPGQSQSFDARLRSVRTERDLDRLFRELLQAYEHQYPAAYTAAADARWRSAPL